MFVPISWILQETNRSFTRFYEKSEVLSLHAELPMEDVPALDLCLFFLSIAFFMFPRPISGRLVTQRTL